MPAVNEHAGSQRELQRLILARIARGAPLRETLDHLCHLVGAMVPDAVCSVMQLDPDHNTLSFVGAPCLPESAWTSLGGLVPGPLAGSCGTAVYTREPAIVEDVLSDPRWAEMRAVAEEHGLKACWSIPLMRGDRALGSFAISRTVPGGPTPRQMELLLSAADLASLALGRVEDVRDLHDHRALLASLLASASDPMFVKDEEGRYLLVNEAESLGVTDSPEGMVGKTDEELYGKELWATSRAQELAVMRSGEPRDFRQSFDNPILGTTTYMIRKSPLRDAQGAIRGIVGVARDVSQLERTEAILSRAQRAESLGILAGGVAHDFNNLLTGVIGNCALAQPHAAPGSPLRRLLDEIEQAAVRASELTDQMLAYAGRAQTQKGPVALAHLVSDVLALAASSLSLRTQVEFDDQSQGAWVYADPSQMRQVVLNLVTNASQALEGRAGKVELVLGTAGDDVVLTVHDEGEGMDGPTQERVFEPFFSTKGQGRGLGLASSLGIAQAHGGSLTCESAPGVGTTFTLRLPRCEPGRGEPEDGAGPAGRAGTILVADDQELIRSLARRVLEPTGHRVIEAVDGGEALRLAREHARELDLLLLDVRMPELNGDEVLGILREEGLDCPVILSSGYTMDWTRGIDPSGVRFLKKPYRPAELLSAVLEVRGS